jgi:hypothetical protein
MTPNHPEDNDDQNQDRPLPPAWKDELLDHELSPADQATAERRLMDDADEREEFAQLQELDATLRRVLNAGELIVADFLERLEERVQRERPASTVLLVRVPLNADDARESFDTRAKSRRTVTVVAMAILGLVVVSALVRPPAKDWVDSLVQERTGQLYPGAMLVRATGPVIVQSPNRQPETIFASMQPRALPAGTTIRTQPGVLCELDLPTNGKTRLREETEVVVETSNQLHLVSGMIWCRADGPEGITVKVPASETSQPDTAGAAKLAAFVCPTESVSSWVARPGVTICQSLSPKTVEIQVPGAFSCTMAPMEQMTIKGQTEPVNMGVGDRLSSMSWQLPLLNMGAADDPELQDLLQQMLAAIGETKMSSLYVQEIRELGPAGTIPLLAYVRNERSRASTEMRRRAMQIIADLAPESARSDLLSLKNDEDPEVQALADRALQRLETPGE